MNVTNAKKIPLASYLSDLGFQPSFLKDENLWYLSPLRDERHPSFKVNPVKNVWFDFGMAKGGTIIDFALLYYNITDVSEALNRIRKKEAKESSFSFHPQSSLSGFEDIKIKPLQNKALIDYLTERGVNIKIAAGHVVEVYFKQNGKSYFAIGFPNRSGGYELRNKYFKGCIAPKDITVIQQEEGNKCNVFEGFIDYLSYLTMKEENSPVLPFNEQEGHVILNGVLNLSKALETLENYRSVICYLDADKAGKTALNDLQKHYPNLLDGSLFYSGQKDLNDFLYTRKMKQTGEIINSQKKASRPSINNTFKSQNKRRPR